MSLPLFTLFIIALRSPPGALLDADLNCMGDLYILVFELARLGFFGFKVNDCWFSAATSAYDGCLILTDWPLLLS